jgi:cysteinyl-tRNA synthetase
MSIKYLGEQFDIHAGGIDHVPIHHTNEIAQSEAATGRHPWVNYWVHNEFLVLDRGKMSKSAGGFITLQSLIDEGYDPLDYRYFLLGGHYRTQLQFSWESLAGARNARKSLMDRVRALANKADSLPKTDGATLGGKAKDYLSAFDTALDDDLSTPRALAELWGLLKDTEVSPAEALAGASDMDRVLGLGLAEEAEKRGAHSAEQQEQAGEIGALIAERAEAKKAKNFARADEIRNSLKDRGIVLEDGPGGTTWRRT